MRLERSERTALREIRRDAAGRVGLRLVCARALEVLQRHHRNLGRMLALNPCGRVGGTSFAATNSLEGFANIGFEAWPVFERRIEDAFHDSSFDLRGPRKPSEFEGANRSADAVLRALYLRPDDARGAGGGD